MTTDHSQRRSIRAQLDATTTAAAELLTSSENPTEAWTIAYDALEAAWAAVRQAEEDLDDARTHATNAATKAAAVVALINLGDALDEVNEMDEDEVDELNLGDDES